MRGLECEHLECFSLEQYIHQNVENMQQIGQGQSIKPRKLWKCEICDKRAVEFIKDEHIAAVINSLLFDCKNIKTKKIVRSIEADLVDGKDRSKIKPPV